MTEDADASTKDGMAPALTYRATAADVARRAGVSRVAVSRAFTPGASIAEATRGKVLTAAATLGYRPNALARQLNRRASEIVAFVGGSNHNIYYAELIDRLLPALQQDGLKTLYVHVGDRAALADALEEVAEYPVACTVVATGSLERFDLDDRQRYGPIVVSGPAEGFDDVDSVGTDSRIGIRLAVDHLVARGRRSIGCLAGPADNPSGAQRAAAFVATLAGHGLAPAFVRHCGYTVAGAAEATRQLLADDLLPGAIVCGNDMIALGVIDVLRGEAGLAVPAQVAVVGFDDISLAGWSTIGLTTLSNPIDQRIAHLRDLVRRRIAEPEAPIRRILIEPRLIVRDTT
ncbi:MAG: LacI family DNA-binding transcriptional regulator [Ancalomicrobiaceae bacterium]|nr:LacI family DNA-binding transcriptional regulator [Ancalomicrobiaceae bacterium]